MMHIYEVRNNDPERIYEMEIIEAWDPEDAINRINFDIYAEGTQFMANQITNEFTMPDGSQAYFVNVYSVNQGYGGPEEGGWWFMTGNPVKSVICHEHEVQATSDRLREEFPSTGKAYSVLGGEDYQVSTSLRPAEPFPAVQPHYE